MLGASSSSGVGHLNANKVPPARVTISSTHPNRALACDANAKSQAKGTLPTKLALVGRFGCAKGHKVTFGSFRHDRREVVNLSSPPEIAWCDEIFH